MKIKSIPLIEIIKTFLVIGIIGFGGGLAIIALIQQECVIRKKWLNLDEFSHGVALGQFLGPFAVNVVIFVGYRIRGLKGAITALISFLAPSVSLVILLTALYLRYQKIPSLQSALNGISPAVIALILYAAYQMAKGKTKNLESIILMILAIISAVFFKVQVIWILLVALIYGVLIIRFEQEKTDENS